MKKSLVLLLTPLSIFVFALLVMPLFKSKAEDDTSAPELLSFGFSKTEIDTEESEDVVTLYVRVSDDVSGVSYAGARMYPESGGTQEQNVQLVLMEGACEGVDTYVDMDGLSGCGDDMDGVYSAEMTFLQGSAVGDWNLFDMTLIDNTNNSVILDFEDFETLEGDGSATITNTAETEDLEGPEIVDYSFDKATIDTTDGEDTLVLTSRISDDMSGVGDNQSIRFCSPEGLHCIDFSFEIQEGDCEDIDEDIDTDGLVGCGDNKDGIYVGTATFPQYSASGVWVDNGVVMTDNLGNQKSDELFDGTFENIATVEDLTGPELTSITMTPSVFDTSDGNVTITIDMAIEDDLSGVDSENGASMTIRPLVSSQSAQSSGFEKISGTYLDGVFRMTIEVPQYSISGLWACEGLSISDELNNGTSFDALSLFRTFPELDLFLVNQALAEEITIESDWTLAEWVYRDEDHNLVYPDISVKFDEGTVITKKEGGIFAFYRLITQKYDVENLDSFIDETNDQIDDDLESCDANEECIDSELNTENLVGEPVHVIKMGIPGLNLLFSKPVTITLRFDEEYLGETFIIQTFTAEDTEWSDQTSCTVEYIDEESGEHGGDEYGEIGPDPRPGCQFTTDHASFFSVNVLGEADAPDTGFGGPENHPILKYFRWIK